MDVEWGKSMLCRVFKIMGRDRDVNGLSFCLFFLFTCILTL